MGSLEPILAGPSQAELADPLPVTELLSPQRATQEGSRNLIPFPKEEGWFAEWREHLGVYLTSLQSAHTRRAYAKDLEHLTKICLALFQKSPLLLTYKDLLYYQRGLRGEVSGITDRPLDDQTVNRKLAAIKSLYQHLIRMEVIDKNPAQHLKPLKVRKESPTRALAPDQVAKVLSFHPKSRTQCLHRAMLMVLLYMGLRRSELVGLKIKDLYEDRGQNLLRVLGKGNKERLLVVPNVVFNAIEDYLIQTSRLRQAGGEEPLLCAVNQSEPLSPDYVYYVVRKYTSAIGEPRAPHALRATCITTAMDHGATHREVQHLAGWSSPMMVTVYDKKIASLKNQATEKVVY